MQVVIIGTDQNPNKVKAVLEALEKMDIEILMIDNSPKTDIKEIAHALRMPVYSDPKRLFEKPKSKYHN